MNIVCAIIHAVVAQTVGIKQFEALASIFHLFMHNEKLSLFIIMNLFFSETSFSRASFVSCILQTKNYNTY